MGTAAEGHSNEIGLHVNRVAQMTHDLVILSGENEENAALIREGAPLHDLGKIAIPDAILHKPGPLTADEWRVMKTHAEIGYKMLNISQRPILQTAATIAYEHHEKWDGSGYPRGLKGEEISLAGRATAIADVFDALASKRCYKDAWVMSDIFAYLKEGSGSHFDPNMIDLLFENIDFLIKSWEETFIVEPKFK
jgi:response regulator RpfG family c-di-GMP phosphodiesterase